MPVPEQSEKRTPQVQLSFFRRLYFLQVILRSNFFWLALFIVGISSACHFYGDEISKIKTDRFVIKKVEFDGNERVPDVLLLKVSGLRYKTSVLSPSIHDIKSKLEGISWIKSVVAQRKFPDKIYVRVSERIPIAILQSKYKLYLVDSEGVILEHDGIGNFNNLVIIAGEGAEKEASHLLYCLDKFPKIKKQLVFAVRIGRRRWNIKINRGITVKFPERGIMQALGILDEISDSNGFFSDDIISIDLRMLDRIVVNRKIMRQSVGQKITG
jgi:cell division protein FtsQ